MATNRQEVYQTGGGVNKAPLVSPVDEATLLVMNKITANGFNNCYDDDKIDGIDAVNYIEEIEVSPVVSIKQ